MIKIMAVYDEDPVYAGRLADYINQKERVPLTAMAFSSLDKLISYGEEHGIAVLLVGERLREAAGAVKAEQIMVLCEGDLIEKRGDEPCIYKYQSGDCIMREVMASYGSCMAEPGLALLGSRALVLGIYSPVNRCMKSSLALTMGQLLSKTMPVLHMSLEAYSGMPEMQEETGETDLSDLYYLYRQGSFHWLKLKSLVRSWGNLDYVAPVPCGEDLEQMTTDEMARLIGHISRESGYDRLVVDVGQFGWGAAELLGVFDVIYMPVLDDRISVLKLAAFEEYLEKAGAVQIQERIQRLRLPRPRGLRQGEAYLDQLLWGEFGDYVRTILEGGTHEQ